jgi:putative ATP-dependent endonuclease of OLD family
MAKKKLMTSSIVSENPDIAKPRLTKIIIKNYRCIGNHPVEIDIDDIVVLVGPNNVGKSTILKAYELVMSYGSKEGDISIEDFPNKEIYETNFPEIEIQTIVYDKAPGDKWITTQPNGEMLVRERFLWKQPGRAKREGWDVELGQWSDNVPWGAPNVSNSRRPEPHRVDAFDTPETQTKEIEKILISVLNENIKVIQESNDEGDNNDYYKLLLGVRDLQKRIVEDTKEQILKINKELTHLINRVFPDYIVDFDPKPEDDLEKSISLFKASPSLLMGPKDGYKSTIDRQGSGARRTLLWIALKIISENSKTSSETRPHVLLLDEPEICLHPNAIREARNVLYDLTKTDNWQVMVTTHSPVFIDFSKDNTTIIKVEKNESGVIKGSTVYRPEKVKLDDDDKKNLKLLNLCDPYVAEFFFGGKVIVVEGDTEYTAFNHIISKNRKKYQNIHIIRARGKATIVSLVKILNNFGSDYSILHDADKPYIETQNGKQKNGAWTSNKNIIDQVNSRPLDRKIRLLASLPNFEEAYLKKDFSKEKPYNALRTISSDSSIFSKIEKLLDSLIDFSKEPPENCVEWNNVKDLELYIDEINPKIEKK